MQVRASLGAAAALLLVGETCDGDETVGFQGAEPLDIEGLGELRSEEAVLHVLAEGSDRFWLVVGEPNQPGGALVHVAGGRVDDQRSLDTSFDAEPTIGYPVERAAADANGRVALTDSMGGDLWVLGPDEERRVGGVPPVTGLAMTDDGSVLVADPDDQAIVAFTEDGTRERLLSTEELPAALAALPGGGVAVVTRFA